MCWYSGGDSGGDGTCNHIRYVYKVRLRVTDLRATVPYPKMKHITTEELQHYKKVTKYLIISMIRDLVDAVPA